MSISMRDSNKAVFNTRAVIADYERASDLLPPEEILLARVGNNFQNRAILDLGVGAGRTTPHLASRCARYVGLDFAPNMIDSCRQRFPQLEFQVADAADLSVFPRASFGMVWFSFNGIDYAEPATRKRILLEAHRVLEPGGIFFFSSHNLHRPPTPPRWLPDFKVTANPLRIAVRLARSVHRGIRHQRNYRGFQPHEVHGDGVAMLIDDAHDFSLLTCYVTPAWQVRQLEETGFWPCTVMDREGRELAPGQRVSDHWLSYTGVR